MNVVFVIVFLILTFSIFLGIYRLWKGPTVLDNILAFDIIAICLVAMIVILSVIWTTVHFIELIIMYSLLGFLGTIAFVYYLNNHYKAQEENNMLYRLKREKDDIAAEKEKDSRS